MKKSYAVIWSRRDGESSGKLEALADRFELRGRDGSLSVPFAEVTAASIGRSNGDRLRGLPVLRLRLAGGERLRIASLEGAGVLLELADLVSPTPAGG